MNLHRALDRALPPSHRGGCDQVDRIASSVGSHTPNAGDYCEQNKYPEFSTYHASVI